MPVNANELATVVEFIREAVRGVVATVPPVVTERDGAGMRGATTSGAAV